ncbi:hypothetical protein JG687_00006331, partial [Phytophthora cactorum]
MATAVAVDKRVLDASRANIESLGAMAEDAFYTIDLQHVANQYRRMVTQLPRVLPFYTVKCHPDTRVLSLLAKLGAGVDCASQSEVAMSLSHGVPPERIIFANTMKQRSHLRFAREHNVPLTVFDSSDELVKIKREFPEAKLVLRLQVDDSKARHQFGPKFGTPMADVPALLGTAKRLELNVVGVCFHVGVGVLDASAFVDAIVRAKQAFAMVLKAAKTDESKAVPCSVWGPTMDGKDAITRETSLPVLEVGDWITFPRMGAYSFATGSTFNGFSLPSRTYIEAE